ncbi:unnamed protein product [Vitrella brassicaformis CCMP3155]|uniref:Uncharacterized protein n=2 Tax=Vitrella brassicaformis TaxID=1169539 RepID=A0A0G4EEV5_VITBC|nr:unnamed protein product [Vitrella brassicaformis CCMP3155]|eukprot:CEL94546.1 unnamed protein product [Vitrella brassicaformis CCMP3155]
MKGLLGSRVLLLPLFGLLLLGSAANGQIARKICGGSCPVAKAYAVVDNAVNAALEPIKEDFPNDRFFNKTVERFTNAIFNQLRAVNQHIGSAGESLPKFEIQGPRISFVPTAVTLGDLASETIDLTFQALFPNLLFGDPFNVFPKVLDSAILLEDGFITISGFLSNLTNNAVDDTFDVVINTFVDINDTIFKGKEDTGLADIDIYEDIVQDIVDKTDIVDDLGLDKTDDNEDDGADEEDENATKALDAMFDKLAEQMEIENPRVAVSADGKQVKLSFPKRKAAAEGDKLTKPLTKPAIQRPSVDEPGLLKLLKPYQDAVKEEEETRRELQRRYRRAPHRGPEEAAHAEGFLPFGDPVKDTVAKLVKKPITEAPTQEKVPNLVVPTIVPGQDGVFPRLDELVDAVPSTTLGDALRAIGVPITQRYVNSTVGQVQNAIGDIVNSIEEFATAYLTKENIDRLELEPIVSAVEQATVALSPLYQVNETDPIWTFAKSITENVWQTSELVDRPEAQRIVDDEVQNRIVDAIACAIIGNANSDKCPVDSAFPVPPETVVTTPAPGGDLNSFGFPQCIEVTGYQPLCEPVNDRGGLGCISGRSLEPQNFDGVYTFVFLDEAGFPVYSKGLATTNVIVNFPFDQSISQLLLSRTPGEVGSNSVLPEVGTFGSITANVDDFSNIGIGQRPPFATTTAGEGESIAPIGCDLNDPQAGEGFPQCLTGGTWVLARAGSGTCTGNLVQGGASCFFGLPSPQVDQITITPVPCSNNDGPLAPGFPID